MANFPNLLTQQQMLVKGAGGHLQYAYEMYVPLDKITGLEPPPANAESEDGEYHPGRRIESPVELSFQKDDDNYVLWAGNHRYQQAIANGQSHILAFVGPDLAYGRTVVGRHAVMNDPDAQIWLTLDAAAKAQRATTSDGGPAEKFSEKWFDERLTPTPGGDEVPAPIRAIAVDFCTTFKVGGLCDPMYVANSVAREFGVGDGRGKFNDERLAPDDDTIARAADKLSFSYSASIAQAGADQAVADVLSSALCQGLALRP